MIEKIKKLYFENKYKFIILIFGIAFVYTTAQFLGYDNPIEESIEWLIMLWTGAKVDLTPAFLNSK